MIEFELDIPSLTSNGIQIGHSLFSNVIELNSSSMLAFLIMIEMLILLIRSFDSSVRVILILVVLSINDSFFLFIIHGQ